MQCSAGLTSERSSKLCSTTKITDSDISRNVDTSVLAIADIQKKKMAVNIFIKLMNVRIKDVNTKNVPTDILKNANLMKNANSEQVAPTTMLRSQ